MALALALSAFLVGAPVMACLNGVQHAENPSVVRVDQYQRALERGDFAYARGAATDDVVQRDPFALERARRIVALAVVRGGSLPEANGAVRVLRAMVDAGEAHAAEGQALPPPPDLRADLGEALARVGQNEEALATLRPLAKEDLIGSPYAYAALARLEPPPSMEAAVARERCLNMADGHPEICAGKAPLATLSERLHARLPDALLLLLSALAVGLAALGFHKRPELPQWRGNGRAMAKGLAVLGVGIGALCAAYGTTLLLSLAATGLAPIGAIYTHRRSMVSDLRRGRVAGLALTLASPDVALTSLPVLTGWVHGRGNEVLLSTGPYDSPYRLGGAQCIGRLRPAEAHRTASATGALILAGVLVLAGITLSLLARG